MADSDLVPGIDAFVAIGDSFTEGLEDPDPGGGFRGWADRVAGVLSAQRPGFRYANLAIRGKLLGEVVAEQLPRAVELAPDLVSLAAGGNDILRRRAAQASRPAPRLRSRCMSGTWPMPFLTVLPAVGKTVSDIPEQGCRARSAGRDLSRHISFATRRVSLDRRASRACD